MNEKNRFELLRSLFKQAPLSASDFNELLELSKKYDKKMHAYLEAHKSELV